MQRSSASKTHKRDFLQFSTPPNHECWWRIEIEAEDLAWIQKNLGHGLDYRKRFPSTSRVGSLPGSLSTGCRWTERVTLIEGESAPRVRVSLDDSYNYHSAYVRARQRRDPHLSPHGLFRNLQSGYHKHAFQFMQKFGPLFIESSTRRRGDSWWLSLADFWDRHARFLAIAKLWEDRFDLDKLCAHWNRIGEEHTRLDRAGDAPLGYIPDPIHRYIQLHRMPWELKENLFPRTKALFQQKLVYQLVHSELILHTQDCVSTWTATNRSQASLSDATAFQPTRCFRSLWGVIWEQFGLDTRNGWRLCRECGRLFYPRDPRSVCCCTQHQSLWSKRKWAREHRGAMRNAKVEKVRRKQ